MSDMAPNTCGIKKVDHLRIINLIEEVFMFARTALKPGGNVVVKTFQGSESDDIFAKIRRSFKKVSYFKPDSSRKESAEMYLVAQGYSPKSD